MAADHCVSMWYYTLITIIIFPFSFAVVVVVVVVVVKICTYAYRIPQLNIGPYF